MLFSAMGNVENGRSADGKAASFPTARKHRFPQLRPSDRLRTFPQRLLLLLKMSAITEMMMALILFLRILLQQD